MRICVFPGTFDPITLGHKDIIDRALDMFDQLIIAIGVNSSKVPMFALEQRLQWIKDIYPDEPRIKADSYKGLTVDYCKKVNARYILRGIRYVSDFEYEKAIADVNRSMDSNIETIFLTCTPQYTSIASTLVRDIIRNEGDVSQFLPEAVLHTIKTQSSVNNDR
ncbi:MAG TPA: pantetheine-phosphate adenylyltransferase [Chitinophaga sp.]